MDIREAKLEDISEINHVESLSFSKEEAASESELKDRLNVYPKHFYVMVDGHKIIGFINGMVSDSKVPKEEMFENASLHNEDGDWQMIFGLAVHPDYRLRGVARSLVNHFIEKSKEEGRKGLVLTVKEEFTDYYSKFGFVDEGLSESQHGGDLWHDMRLTF